jgi:hypothetical protein
MDTGQHRFQYKTTCVLTQTYSSKERKKENILLQANTHIVFSGDLQTVHG